MDKDLNQIIEKTEEWLEREHEQSWEGISHIKSDNNESDSEEVEPDDIPF